MAFDPDGRIVKQPPEPIRARSGCRKLSFACGQDLNVMRSGRLADASAVHRRCRVVVVLFLFFAACHLSMNASADGPSLSEFESRVDTALRATEAALDQEEARLNDLAAQNSGRALADGRPSLGQAAANIRLLDRRIRELDARNRKLREKVKALLASLDSDIATMAQRLSTPGGQAAAALSRVLGRELSPTEADENGWTGLHYAAALNLPALAEALLDAGADVAARFKDDSDPLSERLRLSLDALGFEAPPHFFDGTGAYGSEPLHVAAMANAQEVAMVLLAAGANIHAKTNDGRTPLHHAARYNAPEISTVLVAAGANIHAKTMMAGRRCTTRRGTTLPRLPPCSSPLAPTSTRRPMMAGRRCTTRRGTTLPRLPPRLSPPAPTSTRRTMLAGRRCTTRRGATLPRFPPCSSPPVPTST